MERRVWPWKKKINEQIASAALQFRQSNEQLESRMQLKDQPNGITPLQQAEAKIKILTEQLISKDGVILQHAKVAEEAVSGWEKAESETANMRQQLDVETQKKLAAEDRVSHLDGALKECMKQLRQLRELQEQRIQEMMIKTTKEWEEVCEELKVEIAKHKSNILQAEAEKVAMTKLLQERARTIQEAREARRRSEEEIKLLQVRLDMAEKEQTKWKFEFQVVRKELDIRNEEMQCSKKVIDAANKQHLESVKRTAKLESECERLRLLVQRKLPGPTAVAQMQMEVDERGRRMPPLYGRTNHAWTDGGQISTMAEENKALREALRKSHSALDASRMLFAHTADKLSLVEEQMKDQSSAMSGVNRSQIQSPDFLGSTHIIPNQEPSIISISEDGIQENENNCAESWASALISELAQFSRKKGSSITGTMVEESCSSELMDDFTEMEKLASMLPDVHTVLREHSSIEARNNTDSDKVSDEVRSHLYEVGVLENLGNEMDSAEVRDIRVWSPSGFSSCPSEESISRQDASNGALKGKETSQDLSLAMHKVVQLIEALSQIDYDAQTANGENPNFLFKQERTSEFNACVQSLITLCQGALLDKVDIMDFLAEMASALDWLVSHVFNGLNDSQTIKSLGDCNKSTVERLPDQESSLQKNSCRDNHVEMMKNSHILKRELTKLKLEKDTAEEKWPVVKDLAPLKAQLETSTVTLSSALESKESLVMNMENLAASKKELESQLSEVKDDVKKLEERSCCLESQLQDEIQCRKDIEAMYQDLLEQKSSSARERESTGVHEESILPEAAVGDSITGSKKEQEIEAAAEKLAECQQTILAIEKQLKGLGGRASDHTRHFPHRLPRNAYRSHSMDDDEDKDSKASNKISPLRGHGRQGGALSCGGQEDELYPSLWERNPENTLHHHRSSSIAPLILQMKSPGRSPGRFLSLKAWETSPEPSSTSSITERLGNKGFSRFFSRNKASPQHR